MAKLEVVQKKNEKRQWTPTQTSYVKKYYKAVLTLPPSGSRVTRKWRQPARSPDGTAYMVAEVRLRHDFGRLCILADGKAPGRIDDLNGHIAICPEAGLDSQTAAASTHFSTSLEAMQGPAIVDTISGCTLQQASRGWPTR